MSGEEALRIVHEDDRILAVSKPVGRPVIPGRGEIGESIREELERLRGRKMFVVHRLDRESSGLLVLAKDAATHRRLCLEFEGRRARKIYLALVLGRIDEGGEIDRPLGVFGSGRMGVRAGGKSALTRFRVREALAGATLLEVEPVTGRRHQIRVHLWALGHPILGDPLYGEDRPVGGAARLMLHALALSFASPDMPALRAEPGEDFLAALEGFRGERFGGS